jgi:hypothetical protein
MEYCNKHGSIRVRVCCGLNFCDKCDEKAPARDGKIATAIHNTEKLKCGHVGCNFHTNGCTRCDKNHEKWLENESKMKDMKAVKNLLQKVTNKTLKESLTNWLDTIRTDDENPAKKLKTSKK